MKLVHYFKPLARVNLVVLASCIIFFSVACDSDQNQQAEAEPPTIEVRISTPVESAGQSDTELELAYPAPVGDPPPTRDAGYTGPIPTLEGVLSQPPDPERNLPEPATDSGIIGGVLVRELTDGGYLPVVPQVFYLAEVVNTAEGQPAFIRHNSESPQADLFNTGIFVFKAVPPGDYGLVADIGIGQYSVTDSNGEQVIITVEPGVAVDLGQVFIEALEN